MEVAQIARLLNDTTLSLDGAVLQSATQALDSFSHLPHFPFSLLSISSEGENQGQRVAAATYLKNFIRRNIDSRTPTLLVSREFKDQLLRTLLRADSSVLKVLVDVFRIVVDSEFVRHDSWPELVPDLRSAIQNSSLFYSGGNCQWNTINALTVLHALIRPFQYFLNPKVAKEPVPPQLDLIAKEILVPLLVVFNHLVEKALSSPDRVELEMEKVFLIVCKCMHFSLRSHVPSALIPHLPPFVRNLIGVLGSLRFDCGATAEDGYLMRLKTGKRSLLIFCALITRHRKYSDKLMPDFISCVLRIVTSSSNISKLDFLSERIISLAFDVISHILETGPGWRLVSPHFSFLLDSAIFPALVLNEKDISEWEEDAEEYMRKNLPSELDDLSGWREDLFTARKSAMNLLGVISLSKGPPIGKSTNNFSASSKRKKGEKNKRSNQHCYMGELLVFPFLSRFPIPVDVNSSNVNNYFGVLMAYGGLQDFLKDQKPEHVINLVRTRLLPLYTIPVIPPYLVASANWVIGELASCLMEEMSAEVYSSLLKALAMPDEEDISCYPVRVSAAGAIAELLENDYSPPDWLPLLEAVIGRINVEDEETCILLQLLSSIVETGEENIANHIPFMVSSLAGVLSKHVHPNMEVWPQVLERGFVALAVMAKSWENLMPEEDEQMESSEKWTVGRDTISRALSALLQQAWLSPEHQMQVQESKTSTVMCLDDSSMLLRSIMLSVTGSNVIHQLKLSELLLVWADLISDWHAWEESEDLSVFDCIKEVVSLHSKYGLKDFMSRKMPSPPAAPVAQHSIIESIGAFVSKAIFQYPSAAWRACSCMHMLLHVPSYSYETEGVKQTLVTAFGGAAFSRFREIQSKPSSLWKPLLLVISSCYLCCPDALLSILEKDVVGGFTIWASSLAFVCTESFEPGLSVKSEIKLAVMTLAKVIERLLEQGSSGSILLSNCFSSLMEAVIKLKEVQEEMEEDTENDEEADDNEVDDDDDEEDSEGDEHEETEEEFLERYAKAAAELDDGVEEGDIDEQEHEIELGLLEEADEGAVVLSLIDRYRHLLIQGHTISPQIISRFLNSFPEYNFVFQQ